MIETIKMNLKEAIVNSGYKRTEIAKMIGVTQGLISQYVTGATLPTIDTLARLCKALDVSADYILGLEDDYGRKTPVKTIKICNVKM